MTTLYKLTETSLRSWSITTEESKVIIEHGQYHGQKQVDIHTCSNPSTALTEMDRRIHIKRTKQGYTTTIPTTVPNLPMLASVYEPDKLPEYIFAQPKLDGLRCIATRDTMISRRNEPVTSMPHIQAELGRLPPGIRLDGELYKHGLNFQTHLSLIKRQAIHDDYYQIQYHVFDIQSDETFEHRLNTLTTLINNLGSAFIVLVPTRLIAKSQIDLLAKECFTDYEGAILRDPDSLYKYNARSIGLQKYKWKGMNEFQIKDITCASTGRESGAAILICSIPNSSLTFRARIRGMSIEERQAIYKHRASFIGYWTRVTHEGFSDVGKPLKPRAEGLFRTQTGHQ